MADRSFEEQVRKELETLRLTPDAGVWENVNAELRKEKKHRWLLWFIILTGLAGSAGLYYQFSHPAKDAEIAVQPQKDITQPSTTVPENNNNSTDRNNSTDKKETIPGRPMASSAVTGSTTDHTSRSVRIPNIETRQPEAKPDVTPILVKSDSPVPVSVEKPTAGVERSTVVTTTKPADNTEDKPEQQAKTVTATVNLPIMIQPDSGSTYTAQGTRDKTDVVTGQPVMAAKVDSIQPLTQPETVNAAVSVVKQNKNKWQLFGSAEIGRSGEVVSMPSFEKAVMDLFSGGGANFAPPNAPGSSAGGPPIFNSGNAVLYKTPSRSGGPSFGMHLQLLKTVGKKGSVGISMGYSYYSATVGIGREASGALASGLGNRTSYYLSTDSTTYKNQYHFLSLNGDYYLNFRLGSSTTLRWRMGMGLGLLLSSDVLHFDQSSGILYEDRSALSTVHANLSTGLELGIGKKQSFFIGPQLGYFLSGSSVNGSSESNRHLFNAALRATIAIPKKKK
jgi:hypothetical protein